MTGLDVAPPRPAPCSGMRWDDARLAAWRSVRPLPAVRLPLVDASGCTAAVDLRAPLPMPAVATAAMDGYAVAGTGPWRIAARIVAGGGLPDPLIAGARADIAVVPLPRSAPGSLRAAALADAVAVLDPDRDPSAPVPLLP